jgi:hypothetical protein
MKESGEGADEVGDVGWGEVVAGVTDWGTVVKGWGEVETEEGVVANYPVSSVVAAAQSEEATKSEEAVVQ